MRRNLGGHGGGYLFRLSLSSLMYHTMIIIMIFTIMIIVIIIRLDKVGQLPGPYRLHVCQLTAHTQYSLFKVAAVTAMMSMMMTMMATTMMMNFRNMMTFDVDDYGDRQHAIVSLQTSGHDADKIPRKIAIFDNYDKECDMNKTQPGGPGRGWSWLY